MISSVMPSSATPGEASTKARSFRGVEQQVRTSCSMNASHLPRPEAAAPMILAKSRVEAERSTCRYTTTDGLETSVTSYFGADWRATNGGADEPPGPEVLWPVAFEV